MGNDYLSFYGPSGVLGDGTGKISSAGSAVVQSPVAQAEKPAAKAAKPARSMAEIVASWSNIAGTVSNAARSMPAAEESPARPFTTSAQRLNAYLATLPPEQQAAELAKREQRLAEKAVKPANGASYMVRLF